jgi:beta-glucanase (GH16 family)
MAIGAGVSLASLVSCSIQTSGDSAKTDAQTTPVEDAKIVPPAKNTGQPPGRAFILRFDRNFEPDDQYISDYAQGEDWIATSYDPDNVTFDDAGMTLTIEKRKQRGKPYTGSEFQQTGNYGFGRYEAIMKGAKGSGIVTGFFTHTGPYFDDPHDEIDIELLGRNTRSVQVNYFTNGEAEGGRVVDLDFDYTAAYHLYAFEWAPDAVRWYVDGKLVHQVGVAEAKQPIPRASGRVIANIWTGAPGQYEWMGKPNYNVSSASFRCISHVPMGGTGAQCSDTYIAPKPR